MAIGKHTSLEEAQKQKKLDRFCKEHPTEGNEKTFDAIFNRMAKSSSEDDQTSTQDDDAC